ncbi:hypothetical protein [Haloactinomyces albus]|uniref:Membrane associated rhomboid family serine protease n=1 Tax=Haloactinomyces albus TaxID=1352928 RepID=A0AAE4CL77_9ACTN|nr:hypothetical protein [Haloactinomyces albus]MDR7301076.1 membrane associated rhomboid family serine protease [Haloactinomyces albus]
MGGFDARLWRVLHRVLLMLAVGVVGLLLGLEPRPDRSASLFGLLLVLIVALPVSATVWRLPPHARRALRKLPRHRPLLALTAGLLACVTLLIGWWALVNALFPGTLSPLALALAGVGAAGATTGINRVTRRRL